MVDAHGYVLSIRFFLLIPGRKDEYVHIGVGSCIVRSYFDG